MIVDQQLVDKIPAATALLKLVQKYGRIQQLIQADSSITNNDH